MSSRSGVGAGARCRGPIIPIRRKRLSPKIGRRFQHQERGPTITRFVNQCTIPCPRDAVRELRYPRCLLPPVPGGLDDSTAGPCGCVGASSARFQWTARRMPLRIRRHSPRLRSQRRFRARQPSWLTTGWHGHSGASPSKRIRRLDSSPSSSSGRLTGQRILQHSRTRHPMKRYGQPLTPTLDTNGGVSVSSSWFGQRTPGTTLPIRSIDRYAMSRSRTARRAASSRAFKISSTQMSSPFIQAN